MRRTRTERSAAYAWAIGLGLSCAITGASRGAAAEPAEARAQARAHFDQGVALARRHAYAQALIEFQRAYEISPHFSVLYNIGQALIALGRPTEAVAALDRYVEEGGADVEPSRRAEVDAAIASETSKTGSVEVTVDVPGALVTVDDKPYGRSPLPVPVRVDSGAHRVLAVRESGERREANVNASAGQVSQVHLEFGAVAPSTPAPAHAAAPAPAPEPSGIRSVPARGTPPPSVNAPPRAALHRPAQKTLAYVLEAAGAALLGATAAHFLWNRARYEDWQSRYQSYFSDPSAEHRASANGLARSISDASTVTVALAIGAGVALSTGVVLQLTCTERVSEARTARDRGPFLTLQGAF